MRCLSTGLHALLGLGFVFLAAPVSAIVYAGQVDSGLATDVEVFGTTAYVSEGVLKLYDVSDPDAPVLTLTTAIPAADVEFVGTLGYVVGGGVLTVLNATNPAAPTVLGSVPIGGFQFGTRLAVGPGLALISNIFNLTIVDVSNPTAPIVASDTAATVDAHFDVAIQGTTAYLGAGGRLVVLDVSNPAAPTEVQQILVSSLSDAEDLQIQGNALWIAGRMSLRIYDISAPTSPVEVPFAGNLGAVTEIAFDGDLAIVAGDASSGGNVRFLDATNPLNPVVHPGRAAPPLVPPGTGSSVSGVALSGDAAFLVFDPGAGSATSGVLQILDVQNLDFPRVVGTASIPIVPFDGWNLEVEGDLAYVARQAGALDIFDTSDPSNPVAVGSAVTQPAFAAAVRGTTVYVAEGLFSSCASCGGIRVFDVSIPSNPTEVGFVPTTPYLTSAEVAGDHLLVGAEGTLEVYSLSNPALPTSVGSIALSTTETLRSISVSPTSGLVYVTLFSVGDVQIVSLANPAAPALVGVLPSADESFDTAHAGDLAYVGGFYFFKIFDVSNPASAVELSSSVYSKVFGNVEVGPGGTVFTVGYAFDVSDPASPKLVGGARLGGEFVGPLAFGIAGDLPAVLTISDFGPEYVPEPGAAAMLGVGAAMVFALSSRRRRRYA